LTRRFADVVQAALAKLIKDNKYTHVVVSGSSFGKDILPRLAASFDCQPISEVIDVLVKTHLLSFIFREAIDS